MILTQAYDTIKGGLEWIGFSISEDNTTLIIGEGRVGRSYRPLIFDEDRVDGGWYIEEQRIEVRNDDQRIDIVIDTEEDQVYLLVRRETTIVPESLDLVFTLLRREDHTSPWILSTPHYRQGVWMGDTHDNR